MAPAALTEWNLRPLDKKNNNNARAAAWAIGLLLIYLCAVALWMAVAKPCESGKRRLSGLAFEEWCAWTN